MFKRKKKVSDPTDVAHAQDYVTFLLSLRLRTEGEIRQKMQERGYTSQVIDEVVAFLKQHKYVDDQRYAEIFLDNLKKYKNFGFYGVKKKMLEKKLPVKLVEAVLQEGLTKEDEIKIARRLLNREGVDTEVAAEEEVRYVSFREEEKAPSQSKSRLRAKMSQRLKARGFRADTIAALLF